MEYKKAAVEILELCGGNGNISSVTHCATRLRLFTVDKKRVDTENIKKIKGVLGIVYSGDELQIVLGKNLIPVYNEVSRLHSTGISGGSAASSGGSSSASSPEGKEAGEKDRKSVV